MPPPAREPTPPGRSRRPLGPDSRAIILAGSVVAVLVVVMVALTLIPTFRDRDNNSLGDDVYEIQASTVRSSTPLLVTDLVGGDRPVWITHTGASETDGYRAFSAITPDGCLVEVDRDTLELFRECDGVAVPADGDGLVQYDITYDDGELRIDVNSAARPDR